MITYKQLQSQKICNSNYWLNNELKSNIEKQIYHYLANETIYGTVTPLFPFEVELLNRGYFLQFGELNTYSPNRGYTKGNHNVILGFGINLGRVQDGKLIHIQGFGFYFWLSQFNKFYVLNNDVDKFEDAINGKLKEITF